MILVRINFAMLVDLLMCFSMLADLLIYFATLIDFLTYKATLNIELNVSLVGMSPMLCVLNGWCPNIMD